MCGGGDKGERGEVGIRREGGHCQSVNLMPQVYLNVPQASSTVPGFCSRSLPRSWCGRKCGTCLTPPRCPAGCCCSSRPGRCRSVQCLRGGTGAGTGGGGGSLNPRASGCEAGGLVSPVSRRGDMTPLIHAPHCTAPSLFVGTCANCQLYCLHQYRRYVPAPDCTASPLSVGTCAPSVA